MARYLLLLSGFALAVWILSVGLFVHISSHDPYGWAEPGVESVRSRNLWLMRRDLYVRIGVTSFVVAATTGLTGAIAKRSTRLRWLCVRLAARAEDFELAGSFSTF